MRPNYTTFLLVDSSCANSSMARTTVTLKKGEKGGTKILQTWVVVHADKMSAETLITHAPLSLAQETPPRAEEVMKCIAEAEQLEEVGRSPQLLPTQQLAQMAAEARPFTLDGEEPARKKLQLTVGGKAPQKEFLKAGKVKKTQKY